MNETESLIKLLDGKEKLVAMIAPSFPVCFSHSSIITRLKKLGFEYVTEVAIGANDTNKELLTLMKKNPEKRYITTPCPTIVRMIKNQMPEYVKYLTPEVDSPMVAMSKILKKKYPEHKQVFIGPCVAKKLEANEDYPELGVLVVTYVELKKVFEHFNIGEETGSPEDKFDMAEPGMTKIYPVDGGLSHSSGLSEEASEGEVKIVSGWKECQEAIKDFDINPQVKLLDILFCDGGCIGGPGIKSDLSTRERQQKILDYYKEESDE